LGGAAAPALPQFGRADLPVSPFSTVSLRSEAERNQAAAKQKKSRCPPLLYLEIQFSPRAPVSVSLNAASRFGARRLPATGAAGRGKHCGVGLAAIIRR
jgi:hypothetical protein